MQARVMRIAAGAMAMAFIVGCQNTAEVRVHADSPEADAMLARIAQLAGEWEMTDESGVTHHAATFSVTAVREIMFPGSEMEMTNLYHMAGSELVITHYCAAGNQPRMVASEAAETEDGTTFSFELDRVSNLREGHDHYMGDMKLLILDSGGVRVDWRSYDRAGNLTDPITFVLTRMAGS